MCGICALVISKERFTNRNIDENVKLLNSRLKRRGPNHFDEVSFLFLDTFFVQLTSAVLHLRKGSQYTQPLKDDKGNILLWNGEVFSGPLFHEKESDTKVLLDKLSNSLSESEVISTISSVEGPFSFIYYQSKGFLWFARDIFGRRSLLWSINENHFKLCSIADKLDEWKEVSTNGIYCIDLNQSLILKRNVLYFYPWSSSPSGTYKLNDNAEVWPNVNIIVNKQYTLQGRISNPLNQTVPSDGILADTWSSVLQESTKKHPYVLFANALSVKDIEEEVIAFENTLSDSVRRRAQNQQQLCKLCFLKDPDGTACLHASVGVLFSGGLDSIVIALLADRHVPENQPIDLLNVAFAKVADLNTSKVLGLNSCFDTPDRVTGRNGLLALLKICPKRVWNFVEVNATDEDLALKRKETICQLLSPSATVLDDSIGCAIWFAARGEGVIVTGENLVDYSSPARVFLLGMGADEQLGGYSRHRAVFNNSGWTGLIDELCMELDRIGSRNLGRDDRIIADHGVEARYPFLDENVVSYLNGLPVWIKMNLTLPRGLGEKFLLRLLAYKLGLIEAAALPKRAIQFGSRIAKIENSKEKGSDLCGRLKAL